MARSQGLPAGGNIHALWAPLIVAPWIIRTFLREYDHLPDRIPPTLISFATGVMLCFAVAAPVYIFLRRRELTGIALANCWLCVFPLFMWIWPDMAMQIAEAVQPPDSSGLTPGAFLFGAFMVKIEYGILAAIPVIFLVLYRRYAGWGESFVYAFASATTVLTAWVESHRYWIIIDSVILPPG